MEHTILVIGAGGQIGLPVARALSKNGFRVRVMGRDGELLRQRFDETFEISSGDAASQAAMGRALEGCFGVHISVAHGPREAEIVTTVAQAARTLGLNRISYVSGTSVCQSNAWFPIVREKLKAERMLQETGIPYTIFKPTWFMEVIPNFLKGRFAVCFGHGKTKLHFLAACDFAVLVAKAIAIDDAENKSFRVLGPEAISLYEAIDRARARLAPHIAKVRTMPFWAARVLAELRHDTEMKSGVELVRYFEQIQEGETSPEVDELFGKPETTLDRWLSQKNEHVTKE